MRPLRLPRVRQHDVTDCGAACLHSIARYYRIHVPIARIRQYAGTDRGGTSLSGLIRAADRLGLTARGIRAPSEVLQAIPTPAIAHLSDSRGWSHYVVLYGAKGNSVLVMDPAEGDVRQIGVDEFQKLWTGILLLVALREDAAPSERGPVSPAMRFWRLASPHRGMMLQAVVGAVAYTVLGLATAVFVQKIVDYVIPDGNRDLLDLLGLAMVAVIATQIYLRCVKDSLVLHTGQKIDAGLILGYYRHLLTLPQRFFDTMRVGEIVSRLNDAVKIRVFVNETSLELLVNLLVVVFSFALMLLYSWHLAAIVGASIPLYLLIYHFTNRANRRNQRRAMESAADLEAHVVETVGAATTIRRLGLETYATFGTETRLVRLLRPIYDVGRSAWLSNAAAELVSRASTLALLWYGAVLVLRESLSAGELMSFYALNGHLTAPVLGLIAANRQVQDALVAADRLFDVLDLERDEDTGHVEVGGRPYESIRFRDVCFRYGSRPPLFHGLDLTIRRGTITAIVGESGSGKSTLAALLQRLHSPESGRILFGDIDIRYIRRESLLRSVAVVPQEVVLFTGTLLDNLAPAEHAPDLPRLIAIARAVGMRDLLDDLPAGLDTPIGERGVALSGGQRQRVAIVRALYRRPEILVLDEATSGLDAASEALVFATLRDLQKSGVTIVLITHRLTSAMAADRILVLEKGILREEGTHRELIGRAGVYQALWRSQMGDVASAAAAAAQASTANRHFPHAVGPAPP